LTASERKRRVDEREAKQREERLAKEREIENVEHIGTSSGGNREGGVGSDREGDGGGGGLEYDDTEDDEETETDKDEEEEESDDDVPTEAEEEEEEEEPETGGPKYTDVIVDFETHVASLIWKGEVQ